MKKKTTLFAVILIAGLAAGCGQTQQESDLSAAEETEQIQEDGVQDGESVPEGQAGDKVSAEGFSFADVADREFYFSSGAGGWYTVLYIHEDGSFDGHFQDSNLGDTGENYPNGTLYCSDFTGQFTEPEKVDDMTYRFQIESIDYLRKGEEEIRYGVLYCYGDAYGLEGAEDLYLYLPGSEIAGLPEGYRSWVGYYDLESTEETELPFYGLYNEKAEAGFSSSTPVKEPSLAPVWARQIEREVSAAQAEADRLEEELQNAVAQADMNEISGQIYAVWNNALNTIWEILKENKDEESMETLTEEERYWIRRKEETVQEAGAEVEGGSLYSLVVNSKAADLTRKRVYELAAEAGAPMDTQLIYDGRYFDESIYLYWVGEITDASSLTYCEILIRNVTDTSFDFTVNELAAETDEGPEILSGTARIQDNGKAAVYEGEEFTLTFHFESAPEVFPKYFTVEGWDKLEGKTYMNNNIPGHESG